MRVVINPGSGAVENTTEQNAADNMAHFVTDLKIKGKIKTIRYPNDDYGEGRYCFLLVLANRVTFIQMPGLPLSQVRYMGEEGQNIWHFPRLYVDDSSWIWEFAINCAKSELLGENDED